MGLDRVRKRNRLLLDNGKIPGANGKVEGISVQKKAVTRRVVVYPLPCIHEGAVLEYCKSRHGELAEARHVRDCDIHEKCTRGFVSNLVQSCSKCPDYKPEGEVTTEMKAGCNPMLKSEQSAVLEFSSPPSRPAGTTDITPTEAIDSLPEDQRLQKRWKRPPVWMYGVTTVPERRKDLLPKTLKSLEGAGFPNPIIFVDGDWDWKSWNDEFKLHCVMRYPKMRVFGNWVMSLAELYLRNPNANYYAIFQDDMTTSKNLRQYIEAIEYPEKGYLNLYTFPRNQILAKGKVGFYLSNQKGKGAVGLIFNVEAVQILLTHNHMVGRVRDMVLGHKFVDGSIVESMKKAGWKEYVHNPSLVQHHGFKSTTGNPKHPQATSFKGEDFDLLTLLRK